jgi:hypothetical protein
MCIGTAMQRGTLGTIKSCISQALMEHMHLLRSSNGLFDREQQWSDQNGLILIAVPDCVALCRVNTALAHHTSSRQLQSSGRS